MATPKPTDGMDQSPADQKEISISIKSFGFPDVKALWKQKSEQDGLIVAAIYFTVTTPFIIGGYLFLLGIQYFFNYPLKYSLNHPLEATLFFLLNLWQVYLPFTQTLGEIGRTAAYILFAWILAYCVYVIRCKYFTHSDITTMWTGKKITLNDLNTTISQGVGKKTIWTRLGKNPFDLKMHAVGILITGGTMALLFTFLLDVAMLVTKLVEYVHP